LSPKAIRYKRLIHTNQNYPISPKQITITADWGDPTVPEEVTDVFLTLIERIAARSNEDDILQGHAAYLREDDGDGYSFDRQNGTLRNLLRPEDAAALWKHVSHGRVVA